MVFQPESRFSATGFGFRPSPSEGSGYENEFSYTIHYIHTKLYLNTEEKPSVQVIKITIPIKLPYACILF